MNDYPYLLEVLAIFSTELDVTDELAVELFEEKISSSQEYLRLLRNELVELQSDESDCALTLLSNERFVVDEPDTRNAALQVINGLVWESVFRLG